MREQIFALLLVVAAVLITAGAAYYSPGAGLITAGVLLSAWSWLILGEVGEGK